MASIQSLGIGSGLLTTELLESIIAAEREASDLRLDRRSAVVEAKITAYGEVRSALDQVQIAAASLSNGNLIQGTTATSSNESALTAVTNSTADPGSYSIAIDSVASSHTLASKSYSSVNETIGTGSLTFKLGTTEYDGSGEYSGFEQNEGGITTTINITSGNNSLSGLRDTINKEVDGVTASLVYDGSGYRLLLSSEKTGESNSMEITATGDAGLQTLAYNSAQNDPNNNLMETQRGEDAVLRVNGLEITSASNKVNEVIKGVTLDIKQITSNNLNLNVSRNTGDVADKMEEFVEAYNQFKLLYEDLVKYNPDDESSGLLLGDSTLRSVYTQVRGGLNELVEGLVGAKFSSLAEVGLETDQNNQYQLIFNRSIFVGALEDNADAMAGLLATQQTLTDSQISYVTQNGETKPGSYDIFIERTATQAKWIGQQSDSLAFADSLVIGGSNDFFVLELNGSPRQVSLEHGQYNDGDELALMIQSSINSAFSGTAHSVSVGFDDLEQRLTITSSKFGSASTININHGDPTLANTLGLGSGSQGPATGQAYTGLSDAAFAATTAPGTQSVDPSSGIDFSDSPTQFDLTLTGTGADGTYTINLDEDWGDILDTNGEVSVDRDRNDALTYIQSELNNAGLNGVVTAEFNSANRLVFRTEPEAGTQTIELSNISVAGADFLGLQDGVANSGVNLTNDAEFSLNVQSRNAVYTSDIITVGSGVFETAEDLALAIQTAINADSEVVAGAAGAMTIPGTRDLLDGVDFASDPAMLSFNLNGTNYDLAVTANNGADELSSIQDALDAELGAGVVTASLNNGGLVLTTDATGSNQQLEIIKDGKGATTSAGSVDLSTGVDFSANPANFSLTVDGVDIDVTVDGDGTAGSNDAQSNLAAIQSALDVALTNAGGGGEFIAGDVVARLDDSNQVYFETLSRNGTATEATYGADSSIELKNADINANTMLGLTNEGPLLNGADSFGIDLGSYQGFDSQATVSYQQDAAGNGQFSINFGNDVEVAFGAVNLAAAAQLGFSTATGDANEPKRGLDVKGTINGVEATGNGQYLTARAGNEAATNGYLLGGAGADFSSPVIIDGTNNTLKVSIDGFESGSIVLDSGVYTTGAALAEELEKQINADSNLQDQGKSVDVQFDPESNIFGIFSTTRGSESEVKLTQIQAAAIDVFGFTTSTPSVKGEDAEGESDPAAGLMLRITGSKTGERGSVTLVQGIFNKMNFRIDSYLSTEGLLGRREDALKSDADGIEEDRSALDARISAMQARLQSKFIFNDKLISQLQNTESFLTQQFEAMSAARDS